MYFLMSVFDIWIQ